MGNVLKINYTDTILTCARYLALFLSLVKMCLEKVFHNLQMTWVKKNVYFIHVYNKPQCCKNSTCCVLISLLTYLSVSVWLHKSSLQQCQRSQSFSVRAGRRRRRRAKPWRTTAPDDSLTPAPSAAQRERERIFMTLLTWKQLSAH